MAKANINRVMQMLDPEECATVYELPNIMARESFRLEHDRIATFDELMALCIRYYNHHFNRVVAPNVTTPPRIAHGIVWNILENHYKGGIETAFKAGSKGINGGLSGILDSIRDFFLKEQEEQYFNFTVMECVDVMDLEDVQRLMQQYIERYGRPLDGQHMPTAASLVPKYRDVIRAHAHIVRSIRSRISR
jgi:hypothetical protein